MTDGTNTIRQFFVGLDGHEFSPAFRGIKRTCKYNFKDAGMWRVGLGEDGRLKVVRGDGPADCVVTVPEDVFIDVMAGTRSAFASYLRNEFQITGDTATAQVITRFVFADVTPHTTRSSQHHKKGHHDE